MRKLAVIYHSGHGHTAHIADHVAAGAQGVPNIEIHLIRAEDLTTQPEGLLTFDGYLFGSPTYLGGVSYDEAANRLGSWSGLMAQAGHASPADSFVSGDIKTARMFGRNSAETLHRMAPQEASQ